MRPGRYAVLLLASCGGGGEDGRREPIDAGRDAAADSGGDASTDSGTEEGDAGDAAADAGDAGDAGPCAIPDGDGDGHARMDCGGDDCDDEAADVHPGAMEASEWVSARAAEAGGVGGPVRLAVGADGFVHLAWTWAAIDGLGLSAEIRYATDETGAFVEETLADGSGDLDEAPAISAAPDGSVRVALYADEAGTVSVRYGARAAGVFTFETIETLDSAGGNTGLVIDDTGIAHVSWVDGSTGEVRYSTNDGGWAPESVDPDGSVADRAALALAGDGTVHLVEVVGGAEERKGDLRWVSGVPGAWGAQDLASGVLSDPSPVLVGTELSVAYGRGTDDLLVATLGEAGFVHVEVDLGREDDFLNAGMWTSSTEGPDGLPHVGYLHGTGPGFADPGEVRHARRNADGSWSIEVAASGILVGAGVSLAFDPSDDRLHVAWVQGPDVMHAVGTPGDDGIDSNCDEEDAR